MKNLYSNIEWAVLDEISAIPGIPLYRLMTVLTVQELQQFRAPRTHRNRLYRQGRILLLEWTIERVQRCGLKTGFRQVRLAEAKRSGIVVRTLSALTRDYGKAVREHHGSVVQEVDGLLKKIQTLAKVRNVLWYGSCPPDVSGKSLPFFVTKKNEVVDPHWTSTISVGHKKRPHSFLNIMETD